MDNINGLLLNREKSCCITNEGNVVLHFTKMSQRPSKLHHSMLCLMFKELGLYSLTIPPMLYCPCLVLLVGNHPTGKSLSIHGEG